MYEGNPVLPNQGIKDFRDPKVRWHEESELWIMTLAAKDRVQIYRSPDLLQWEFASEFGVGSNPELGVWECPDLFPLRVEGTDEKKWVMIISHGVGGISPNGGSCTRYYIGDFDGKDFKTEDPLDQYNWLDYGKDNYAGITWSDIPADDGRRLFIGWMSNWQYAKLVPSEGYRSAMTLPRELTIKETEHGLKLHVNPVKELVALRSKETAIDPITFEGIRNIPVVRADQSEVQLTFDSQSASSKAFGLQLMNDLGEYVRISFDKPSGMLIIDRSRSGKMNYTDDFQDLQYIPLTYEKDLMNWQVFFDRSSMDVFIDDGRISIVNTFFPTRNFNQLKLFSFEGSVELVSGKVFDLTY